MKRSLLVVALAGLIGAPAVLAHGGAGPTLYRSTVERIQPRVAKVRAQILGGDDRIRLYNGTGKTVVVLGYQGEPYLRFEGNTVYVNRRSPAAYLNKQRYGQVTLPPSANAKAPPKWSALTIGSSYDWHDQRIHWMSTVAPLEVQLDPQSAHHIFDWRIPFRVDGDPYRLIGRLDYVPVQVTEQGSAFPTGFLAGVLGGALLLSAAGYFAIRSRRA